MLNYIEIYILKENIKNHDLNFINSAMNGFYKFQNSMKRKSSNWLFCLFLWNWTSLITILGLDYLIDFSSQIKLKRKIEQLSRKSTTSYDQVYFLFDDKTIRKYSNQLTELSSSSLDKKNLSMFGIYALNKNTEFYYGIVESGNNQILVCLSSSPSIVLSIKDYTLLKHIQLLKFSNNRLYDMLIYREDVVFRLVNNNGSIITKNFTNFTENTTQKNSIEKVIKTHFNGYDLNVVFSSLNHVYLIQYNASQTNPILKSITKIKDLSLVQNLTLVSTLIDNWEILIVQFSNHRLYAFHMFDGSEVFINSNLQMAVGSSTLKALHPGVTAMGGRTFMFNNKSIRVNLENDEYSYCYIVQNYTITSFTGVFPMNHSYSFVYTLTKQQIYFLNATALLNNKTIDNQTNSSNNNMVLCQLQGCQICDFSLTQCLKCMGGYWELQKICYIVRNCSTLDCNICNILDVCLECNNQFWLDDSSKICIFNESVIQQQKPESNETQPLNANNDNDTEVNESSLMIDQSDDNSVMFSSERLEQTFNSFSPEIKDLNTISCRLNGLPGARILLTFLNPIFGFFDDYWYYIYHEDSYPQLEIIPNFLVFMYFVNNERIFPDYLQFDNKIDITSMTSSNYTAFTHHQIYQINQQQTYFLANIQQMLFEQYILLTGLFAIIKFLQLSLKYYLKRQTHKVITQKKQLLFVPKYNRHNERLQILKKARQNHYQSEQIHTKIQLQSKLSNLIQIFVQYIQSVASFKSILINFVGSNLIFLAFNFSSQLKIFAFFTNFDLANLVLTLIFGFIILVFITFIVLYVEVFTNLVPFGNKKSKKFKKSQYNNERRDCQYMTYFQNGKNLAYGVIHGYFCDNTFIQYCLLVSVKIFLICILLNKTQIVRNKAIKAIIVTYFTTGIGVDILCLLSIKSIIPQFMMVDIVKDLNCVNQTVSRRGKSQNRTARPVPILQTFFCPVPKKSSVNCIELLFIGIIILSLCMQLSVENYLEIKSAFCQDTTGNTEENQDRPKRILVFLKRIVPVNIIINHKQQKRKEIRKNPLKKNKDSRSFVPESSSNIRNSIFLKKIIQKVKFQKKIQNNENNRNRGQFYQTNDFQNIKPSQQIPSNQFIKNRPNLCLNRKLWYNSRLHLQKQVYPYDQEIERHKKEPKRQAFQFKNNQERIVQSIEKKNEDNLLHFKRKIIPQFSQNSGNQDRTQKLEQQQAIKKQIPEKRKFKIEQRYMIKKKHIKQKEAIKNRIIISKVQE